MLRCPLISGQRNYASSRIPDFWLDGGLSKILESRWHEMPRRGRLSHPTFYIVIYIEAGADHLFDQLALRNMG